MIVWTDICIFDLRIVWTDRKSVVRVAPHLKYMYEFETQLIFIAMPGLRIHSKYLRTTDYLVANVS
jgi:hypothetical protein